MKKHEDLSAQNDNLALFAIDALSVLCEYAIERRGLGEGIDDHGPIYFRVNWQSLESKPGQDAVSLEGLGKTATFSALAIEFNEDIWGDEIAAVSAFDDALGLDDEQIQVLAEIASSRPTDVTQLG